MGKAIQLKNAENEKIYVCPYFPVGSIYLSVVNTNPTKWFGGTWEQIAKGRTLVGVDENDTNFNTVKKTGGEKTHTLTIKEMPAHNHPLKYGTGGSGAWGTNINQSGSTSSDNFAIANTGGGQPHNNMPPYYTVYIFVRTA